MQNRRLIAFSMVIAALVFAAVVTTPEKKEAKPLPPRPAPRTSTPAAVTVAFRHPVGKKSPVRSVRRGAHALVRVEAGVAGNVEIPGLGLVQAVSPGTPAVLDVLATRTGRFEVSLVSVAAERTRLGVLEVNE